MKDLPYLTHDIGSRNNPKLVKAERESRGLFKAIWWDIVDMLWEQGGYLPMDFEEIAYSLRYPTPEEVRRVVLDFELFKNDGERFWNESALERIEHKKKVSATNAENRRGKTSEKGTINERSTNDNQTLSINKLNNKLINQGNNISIPASSDAEKRDIYRLFFFKNFKYPEQELRRFLDRYEGNWTRTGSTIPERDHMRLARTWKPENTEPRFADADFLPWLKTFAAWVAGCGEDPDAFIQAIKGINVTRDKDLRIIMTTAEWCDRMNRLAPKMTDQDAAALTPPYRSIAFATYGK